MVEYPALARVVLSGDVDACLLVQPPVRQREVVRDDTLRARRSPRAVKARSISARPKRTSSASLTRRPGPGPTGRRHACGTLLEPRPVPRPAGFEVPPEPPAAARPGTQPTAGERGQAARRDAQPALPAVHPIAGRQRALAPLAAVRTEPRSAPTGTPRGTPIQASSAPWRQGSALGDRPVRPGSWGDSPSR